MRLPKGWTERTVWTPRKPGVLAYYNRTERVIEYYPRWWLLPVWWLLKWAIRRHEVGHAWGLNDCVGRIPGCIMYEDQDDWSSKLRLLPAKVLYGGQYCLQCQDWLETVRDSSGRSQ
jgi:hypothetical protein